MSGHNWKPGDVAMVRCSDGHERRAISGKAMLDGSPVWVFRNGTRRDAERSIARPLVVIDPEDREQVKRLDDLLWATNTAGEATDDLQAALREFAAPTPPKPDEPQGLGAVVEDAEGVRWLAVGALGARGGGGGPFRWARNGAVTGRWRKWADINAVHVLSEGVQ